ncbi:MAG: zinc-dependent alcohol dehydrogenase family protein [Kofleriaceae bacterium]
MTTMNAWVLEDRFGIDALRLAQCPIPAPGHGEVLVRVRAASLNYHDLMVIEGAYGPLARTPLVPVADGAGEVVAVGPGVSRVRPGDRVCGIFAQRWIGGRTDLQTVFGSTLGSPRDGMLAEYVLLDGDGAVRFPDHLSFEEASTLPIAGVTAWHALWGEAPLAAGGTVVVQGTGGVAVFAIQLARAAGARVIALTRSAAKVARARELGAHEVIDTTAIAAWDERVLALTGGVGADLVIDVAGGDLSRALRAARWGGQVSLVGLLAGGTSQFEMIPILTKNLRLQGISVGPRELFEQLDAAVAHHRIRPVIHQTYAFEDARTALLDLRRGAHVGKLVIRGAG